MWKQKTFEGVVFIVETNIIPSPFLGRNPILQIYKLLRLHRTYNATIIRVSAKEPSTHSEITLPYVS